LAGCWDYHRLFVEVPSQWAHPSPRWATNIKSTEQYRAYRILKEKVASDGKGRLFLFLHPQSADPSLFIASFGSNLLKELPEKNDRPPAWAAVVCDSPLIPFLQRRFETLYSIDLSEGLGREDGGLALAILPAGALKGEDLAKWEAAEQASRGSFDAFLRRPTGTSYDAVLKDLTERYESFRGDPFLESCFWEKVFYLRLQSVRFGDAPREEGLRMALEAIVEARQKGYPAAHFFHEEGMLWRHFGKSDRATQAFKNEASAPAKGSPAVRKYCSDMCFDEI